jgi:hypothetical protein
MNGKAIAITLAGLLAAGTNVALACEYKKGETKYLDYAKCRYGEDTILVVELNDNSAWDQCIYQAEAFRPEKLLAVTKDENGKETLSINDRSQIGNPCYMTKRACDTALKAWKAGN